MNKSKSTSMRTTKGNVQINKLIKILKNESLYNVHPFLLGEF